MQPGQRGGSVLVPPFGRGGAAPEAAAQVRAPALEEVAKDARVPQGLEVARDEEQHARERADADAVVDAAAGKV